MPEPRSSLYRMAKAACQGDVRSFIQERREQGDSFEMIAREISAMGVIVSQAVVANWSRRLGTHEPASKAAAAS